MKPEKVFILVGGADLIIGRTPADIAKNYEGIIKGIREGSPASSIYVQSILPTRHRIRPLSPGTIIDLNRRLKALCDGRRVSYIDINGRMTDAGGLLDSRLTLDGVHLNGRGYRLWRDVITRYLD
ncbi:MAG: hypothetical protein E4G96_09805 [Chrysiogenales bacterium]|nr:MAG: hypothetical protein E4G96_09805 [Chrysiogenales bacterium]